MLLGWTFISSVFNIDITVFTKSSSDISPFSSILTPSYMPVFTDEINPNGFRVIVSVV